MRGVHAEIQEIVDRETRAWDTQDVDLLLTIFHPDMVWPWPARYDAHDPAEWRLVLGRFDADRWHAAYADLFAQWELVHNRRTTVKIEVSQEEDGAFAVVDIDTLWRRRDGSDEMRWKGRVCKVYSRVGDDWKMTMHTGALLYPETRKALHLDHAVIAVSDWERSKAFYRDVLGAEVLELDRTRLAFRFGEQQLNVHGPGSTPEPVARVRIAPGNADLCFTWPGTAQEATAHLEAHGVDVEVGPVERTGARGPGTSVYFRDPDGALLELIAYAG
jgi:catechol 2,3-dioxygenase-like lactoylglutathione lyase family enzyme